MNALSHATSRDLLRSLRALYVPGLHARPPIVLIGARGVEVEIWVQM
jgi:hypothetical protein